MHDSGLCHRLWRWHATLQALISNRRLVLADTLECMLWVAMQLITLFVWSYRKWIRNEQEQQRRENWHFDIFVSCSFASCFFLLFKIVFYGQKLAIMYKIKKQKKKHHTLIQEWEKKTFTFGIANVYHRGALVSFHSEKILIVMALFWLLK